MLGAQAVTISTSDASIRGIGNGVTERIIPGVVDVPQGAWYSSDDKGLDRGGCANILTRDEPSPGGSFPANTALVEVQKIR